MHSDHVDTALGKIRNIFVDVSSYIEGMNSGDKIPATKLAAMYSEKYDLRWSDLYPTLKFLFTGYPGIEIKRGAHGGIFKL